MNSFDVFVIKGFTVVQNTPAFFLDLFQITFFQVSFLFMEPSFLNITLPFISYNSSFFFPSSFPLFNLNILFPFSPLQLLLPILFPSFHAPAVQSSSYAPYFQSFLSFYYYFPSFIQLYVHIWKKSIFLYFFTRSCHLITILKILDSFLIFHICLTVLVQLLQFRVLSSFIATNCINYDFPNIIEMD